MVLHAAAVAHGATLLEQLSGQQGDIGYQEQLSGQHGDTGYKEQLSGQNGNTGYQEQLCCGKTRRHWVWYQEQLSGQHEDWVSRAAVGQHGDTGYQEQLWDNSETLGIKNNCGATRRHWVSRTAVGTT